MGYIKKEHNEYINHETNEKKKGRTSEERTKEKREDIHTYIKK